MKHICYSKYYLVIMSDEILSKPVDVGTLKKGSYVIIEEEPCRIVDISKSKPGKHGSAKARVTAIGVFDGTKRSFVKPVGAKAEVPMIDKKTGQIIPYCLMFYKLWI